MPSHGVLVGLQDKQVNFHPNHEGGGEMLETDVEEVVSEQERTCRWEKTYQFKWTGRLSDDDCIDVVLWAFDPPLDNVRGEYTGTFQAVMLGDDQLMGSSYLSYEIRRLIEKLRSYGAEYASLRIVKTEGEPEQTFKAVSGWWPRGNVYSGRFYGESLELVMVQTIPLSHGPEPYFADSDEDVEILYRALFRMLRKKVRDDELEQAGPVMTSCRMLRVEKEIVACPVGLGVEPPEDEDD